jgi:hypothetical protein
MPFHGNTVAIGAAGNHHSPLTAIAGVVTKP